MICRMAIVRLRQLCGAATSPLPISAGSTPAAMPTEVPEPTTLVASNLVLSGPVDCSFSAQSAATPATCGVAMLVPLFTVSPPLVLAEVIPTPGPDTTAPVLENGATTNPDGDWPSAATEMKPSATAGGLTAILKFGLWSVRLSGSVTNPKRKVVKLPPGVPAGATYAS